MSIVFGILFVASLGLAILFAFTNKRLEKENARLNDWATSSINNAQAAAEQRIAAIQRTSELATEEARRTVEEKVAAVRREAEASLAEAQRLVDQQYADIEKEAARIRAHYEDEARKSHQAAEAMVSKVVKEAEALKKYQHLQDAETQVQQRVAEALQEAGSLRAEARSLLEMAGQSAANEKALATERSRQIREQADAMLDQATRDSGRILAEAEKRAETIGGDAYIALRDKQTLEMAVQALWNVTEGYGDRYVVPTHSLLDDLAIEFGYDAAGAALKSARDQSRRMVEQKLASACNYQEADRRERANRFVVDAFNGRVDAILSRSRHDNYGTLQQEIRDAFSLVNLNGLAFRDARILPAYLDARLLELKWAVAVHELARKLREEQRFAKEKLRDEEKARKQYEEQMRQAARDEELKRQAVREAEERFANASAEQKQFYENELEKVKLDLADATQKILTIAQLTKKGHVYVISNIGSFGDGVLKIGQTRRPDPQERIDELGDASVPFEFDVHALIESDNAPALEHKIHKQVLALQINKQNPRKEFFRVTLAEVRKVIDGLKNGEDFNIKHWTEKALAEEYRESLSIESDPQKKEKWLARQRALTERQLRLDSLQLPSTLESSEALISSRHSDADQPSVTES